MIDLSKSLNQATSAYMNASQNNEFTAVRSILEEFYREKENQYLAINPGALKIASQMRPDTTADLNQQQNAQQKGSIQAMLVRCLLFEEELIKRYQRALTAGELSKKETQVYLTQLSDCLVTFNQLRSLKQSIHYQ